MHENALQSKGHKVWNADKPHILVMSLVFVSVAHCKTTAYVLTIIFGLFRSMVVSTTYQGPYSLSRGVQPHAGKVISRKRICLLLLLGCVPSSAFVPLAQKSLPLPSCVVSCSGESPLSRDPTYPEQVVSIALDDKSLTLREALEYQNFRLCLETLK